MLLVSGGHPHIVHMSVSFIYDMRHTLLHRPIDGLCSNVCSLATVRQSDCFGLLAESDPDGWSQHLGIYPNRIDLWSLIFIRVGTMFAQNEKDAMYTKIS